jgi:putative NADH-flavin reductase
VALLDQGFEVTVLSRTTKQFPAGVTVKVVDFGSTESLSAAIQGQDAVIDNTFTEDAETPLRLIDAAAASGVYRLWVLLSLFLLEITSIQGYSWAKQILTVS